MTSTLGVKRKEGVLNSEVCIYSNTLTVIIPDSDSGILWTNKHLSRGSSQHQSCSQVLVILKSSIIDNRYIHSELSISGIESESPCRTGIVRGFYRGGSDLIAAPHRGSLVEPGHLCTKQCLAAP